MVSSCEVELQNSQAEESPAQRTDRVPAKIRKTPLWIPLSFAFLWLLSGCTADGSQNVHLDTTILTQTPSYEPSPTSLPTATIEPVAANLGEKVPGTCSILGSDEHSTLFAELEDLNGSHNLEGGDVFAFENEWGNPEAHSVWEFAAPDTPSPVSPGKAVCIGKKGGTLETVKQYLADWLFQRRHPFQP